MRVSSSVPRSTSTPRSAAVAARGVAVEEQDHALGVAAQQARVGRGQGRPGGGDDMGDPVLHKADDVHVPLDDQGRAAAADRLAGRGHPVEHPALVVDGGLRGVEVLRLVVVSQGPRPEGDGAPRQVGDRKDEAVPEAVVVAAAVAAGQGEAGLLQLLGPGIPGAGGRPCRGGSSILPGAYPRRKAPAVSSVTPRPWR